MQHSKTLRASLAILGIATCIPVSASEFETNLVFTSDYLFDGVSQTDSKPAIQINTTYAHDSGFYANIWASNVDLGDSDDARIEIDYTLGYSSPLNEQYQIDIGAAHYTYLGVASAGYDFTEAYISFISFENTTASIYLADNDEALNGFAYRMKVIHLIPLPEGFGLGLEATYVNQKDLNFDWVHYKIGFQKSFGDINVDLSYQNTNINDIDDPYHKADGRISLNIGLTF